MIGTDRRRVTRVVSALGLTAVMLVGLAACGSSGSQNPSRSSVLNFAEQPSLPPNFIFPFMSSSYFGPSNTSQFQYLMYRPLYWFGQGTSPSLNPAVSLAAQPQYTLDDKTVTISLRGSLWSNGESVDAIDVMFWMNMLHAERTNWADYTAGGIPDDVSSARTNSDGSLTIQLTGPVNPRWFTYNELSQITPLPLAWDITAPGGAPGSGGCAKAAYGTADASCAAVYTFLSKQSGYDPSNPQAPNSALDSYASNPIWQVVDGPYHLTSFSPSGAATLQANPSYSGQVHGGIKTFNLIPFSTESTEFDALVNRTVDVGYLPLSEVTSNATSPTTPGANNPRLPGYALELGYQWSTNYFPYNFNSTGDGGNAGAIFRQLYFRQAFQSLIDQDLYIQKVDRGYGTPTFGPVPSYPENPFSSSSEASNPYPYSTSAALKLLTDHGWKISPGGISTCGSPGTGSNQCGAGIPLGAKLDFSLQYTSGVSALTRIMDGERAAWSQLGINVTLSTAPLATVLSTATPCSGGGCSWELASDCRSGCSTGSDGCHCGCQRARVQDSN